MGGRWRIGGRKGVEGKSSREKAMNGGRRGEVGTGSARQDRSVQNKGGDRKGRTLKWSRLGEKMV